jgi:hypothetical protein
MKLSFIAQTKLEKTEKINIYQKFWKEELEKLSKTEIETLRDQGHLTAVDAAWVIWYRGQSPETQLELRQQRITGPSPEDDLYICMKADTESQLQAMELEWYHPDEEPEEQSEAAGLLSMLVSELVPEDEPDPYAAIRRFIALVCHLRPGTARLWGGVRKLAQYCDCSHAAVHNELRKWEKRLGARTRNQRSDTFRSKCKGKTPGQGTTDKDQMELFHE